MSALDLKRSTVKSERVRRLVKERHKLLPIGFYTLKDKLLRIATNSNFIDAALALAAFLAATYAFGYYPYALVAALAVALFAIALYKPFIGVIALMAITFPMLMYTVPALALVFMFIISVALVYGYMHYRTMMFAYILVALAFSPAGYTFFIPFLVVTPLVVGFRRAAIAYVIAFIGIAALSGVLGVQNYAFVIYNAAAAHSALLGNPSLAYITPQLPRLTLQNLASSSGSAYALFKSSAVIDGIDYTFLGLISSLANSMLYLLQLAIAVAMAFGIDLVAVTSRSKYKGTKASFIGLAYPITALGLALYSGQAIMYVIPFASFVLAPIAVAFMELYNIHIVKALDVKKQDVRMKFGEAFEDLEQGNVTETFDDVGNYDRVKKELKEAAIGPIEQRGVSRAYNVNPVKGIVFFGPPGTGKTMMMRALANEIHANFYYVKSANLISAYPGESEKILAGIFDTAKKNTPCVLFIDEIDTVCSSRLAETDDVHRHLLSQFLQEMDGFEKLDRVLIVGATNIPNALDSAVLRPGRFDRVIYMHLPDEKGRKAIFDIYLSKLPIAKDVNISKLAKATERYSGADIRGVCQNVAQEVAQRAAAEHRIIEIGMDDLEDAIRKTKASTSLAQVDEYNKFKLDFDRSRGVTSTGTDSDTGISFDDVIGLEDAKKAVVEAVQLPLMHPDLIAKYDIKNINGILLFGPPGTGKTMLMKAITHELRGITMLEINGATLQQGGMERAGATIKDIFYRAQENKPSIIFIDEIDDLVADRGGASEYAAQVTGEFLQEMDGIRKNVDVVVVGATNKPDALDPAILRPGRFDKLIFVRPPDAAHRAALFKAYLSKVPVETDFPYARRGSETKGFTGADIASTCREAKTLVMERAMDSGADESVRMDDMLSIIHKMKPSAPDSVMSSYLAFYAKYGQR
jgi:SpoVK/Ycf46/Vps4 family AAA+-type ATPase